MDYLTMDDGLRLAYRLDGVADAPALVLSNSLGTDMRMWDPQIAALSPHFHIVRYDTRGHGQSEIPTGPATIERLGLDLLAVLDHLAIARAHLCGLSLGGMTVLWLAARHHERVDHAVLANTAGRIGSLESWQARIDAVQAGGMAAVRETVVARFLSAEFRARRPDVTAWVADMLTATDPRGYIAACAALREADLHPIVPAIHVPALIIAGALDESTPPQQAAGLHAALAGSALVVLPGTAHLSNIEQPAAFNAYLPAFLIGAGVPPLPMPDR